MAQMTDGDLKSLISQEETQALGYHAGDLSREREKALDYYHGNFVRRRGAADRALGCRIDRRARCSGRHAAGSARHLPLVRRRGEVRAAGAGGRAGIAQQATDAANYVFYRQNNGALVLYEWFKSALLEKNGVVKYYHEKYSTPTIERYDALNEQSFRCSSAAWRADHRAQRAAGSDDAGHVAA
jgi:hypothetical protein